MSPSNRVNTYRIMQDGQAKGPYTFAQLRSMWASGHLTADALYRQEGAADWEPIERLALDTAIQETVSTPAPPLPSPEPTRLPKYHVHPGEKVVTKSRGSGVVAVGSILCFIGLILMVTPVRTLGAALLFIGFFVAVVGRMMS
jgi:hypothetical protein